jgi:hypothetical protein
VRNKEKVIFRSNVVRDGDLDVWKGQMRIAARNIYCKGETFSLRNFILGLSEVLRSTSKDKYR